MLTSCFEDNNVGVEKSETIELSGYILNHEGLPVSNIVARLVNKGLVDTTDENGAYSFSV
jgi:hypothetical protein